MILISCFFPAQKAPSSEKYHHCIPLKKKKASPTGFLRQESHKKTSRQKKSSVKDE